MYRFTGFGSGKFRHELAESHGLRIQQAGNRVFVVQSIMFIDILLIVSLLCAFLYWLGAARSKETARQAGRRACDKEGVQFLDDTVVLVDIGFRRGALDRLSLYREYQFEFATDGGHRYGGEIIIQGGMLQRVTLEPYRIP